MLAARLHDRIRREGPITVAAFMEAAVTAYYGSRDPFGAQGDFTTAPEISQAFGELISLWCAQTWVQMGSPAPVVLAELGPGRGTLMADALRAAKAVPAFAAAARVHLVETSPALRQIQAKTLAAYDVTWPDSPESLPDGPLLVIANEFFDALPIRQFVRTPSGWQERRVGSDGTSFHFVPPPEGGEGGMIKETSPLGRQIAAWLGLRLARAPGAALIIDYGAVESGTGDTLQALRRHHFTDPLTDPGEADLTAHVDFQSLAAAAQGAKAWGPVTQGEFLDRLGLAVRCAALGAEAEAAGHRLTDPAGMGSLFKVMALTSPAAPPPAGFE